MSRLRSVVPLLLCLPCLQLAAQTIPLRGRVTDPQGRVVRDASILLTSLDSKLRRAGTKTRTDANGRFAFQVNPSETAELEIEAVGFRPVRREVRIGARDQSELEIVLRSLSTRTESVTVTADVGATDVLSPDPGEKVFVRQDLLDANPERPGAPVSTPGYPIETASSGIKAPQYFAPGVAGDHGEPIAQYITVGNYLLSNNLSANAHGNGYADPNILIPESIESVQIDGGAFDVREGNHAVNLAASYSLRSLITPFTTVTADYRDISLVTGISSDADWFVTLSAGIGNGFLDRLEHRQQYKLNAERVFHFNRHTLSLLGIGYYGVSYIPGLVPLAARNIRDTIDPRQHEQTHTALIGVNDVWQITNAQHLEFSGFFRTYNLSLFSNFGQGLIRQSEFRTETGASANYINRLAEYFSLLAGLDYQREAPRRDDLDHYGMFDSSHPGYYGPFVPVDGNNVTIGSITPYIAASGAIQKHIRYYVGWRRDQISVDNNDLLHPQNSSHADVGINSPKATISFVPGQSPILPSVSLSFGHAFYTNDPRIGLGNSPGTPVSTAHSYQLEASKRVYKTDVRVTLGHVTRSQTLAKIDPDTGLQFDEGPSRLRFATLAVRRNSSFGSFELSLSKADARSRFRVADARSAAHNFRCHCCFPGAALENASQSRIRIRGSEATGNRVSA